MRGIDKTDAMIREIFALYGIDHRIPFKKFLPFRIDTCRCCVEVCRHRDRRSWYSFFTGSFLFSVVTGTFFSFGRTVRSGMIRQARILPCHSFTDPATRIKNLFFVLCRSDAPAGHPDPHSPEEGSIWQEMCPGFLTWNAVWHILCTKNRSARVYPFIGSASSSPYMPVNCHGCN
jgi:hypothetical protein